LIPGSIRDVRHLDHRGARQRDHLVPQRFAKRVRAFGLSHSQLLGRSRQPDHSGLGVSKHHFQRERCQLLLKINALDGGLL